jgi:hypothetical protein
VYAIYSGETLIGHSALEKGDAPMGVAFGTLIPAVAFDSIRSEAEPGDASNEGTIKQIRAWRGLTARMPNGARLECQMGVEVLEYGDVQQPFALEVYCSGIPYPLYEKLFPHHVESYRNQFE